MADDTNKIIPYASDDVPRNNTFMSNHVGSNDKIDNDIDYINKQKEIIKDNNDSLYQRDDHDIRFDIPEQGFNIVQNLHPLGINMVKNHGEKGFDYRDFPKEIAKNKDKYDSYLGYVHKNGLIGKIKSNYITHYINIDSRFRNTKQLSTNSKSISLGNNPLSFRKSLLKIQLDSVMGLNPNDKISIIGLPNKELTLRTFITNDAGLTIRSFILEENIPYMTVNASTNMNIDATFIDVKDDYTDIQVSLCGFIGDKLTQWLFDTRSYIVTTENVGETTHVCIEENVYAVSSATANLPENMQQPVNITIVKFIVDSSGRVLGFANMNDDPIPYPVGDLRWTNPPSGTGDIIPDAVPVGQTGYIESARRRLQAEGIEPPTFPVSFYDMMLYVQKTQNIIRQIFANQMNEKKNFIARFNENNDIYETKKNIVLPDRTHIRTSSSIGNISLNTLNATHRMYLTSDDVLNDLNLDDIGNNSLPSSNKFYINLGKRFMKKNFKLDNIYHSGLLRITVYEENRADVTITYLHYGGVPNKLIATNTYSNDNISVSGFKFIKNVINKKCVSVELDRVGFFNSNFGGDCISIGIIDIMRPAYQQPNRYIIELEKAYTNVVMIKMISSIFPSSHKTFLNGLTGGKQNNKFYWQNLDDGEHIYSIQIEPGCYNPSTFKIEFEKKIQNVMRLDNNILTNVRNYILLDIIENTNEVIFSSYNEQILNNEPFISKVSFTVINQICIMPNFPGVSQIDPENEYYYYPSGGYYEEFANVQLICDSYRIKIFQPNHKLSVHDEIIITGSLNYEDIPAGILNKTHVITQVIDNDHYDIVLNNVNLDSSLDMNIKGGNNVTIYGPNKFRIRFDMSDTIGKELGFRNVGHKESLTPYQHIITNDVLYQNETLHSVLRCKVDRDIDTFENIDTASIRIRNPVCLDGPTYLLIVSKEIATSTNLGTIKDYFYKINFKCKCNDFCKCKFLYDTFVDAPIFYNEPLKRLTELSFVFFTPTGELYDFNNLDHSFVLEIITFEEVPENTGIRKH